VTEVDLPSCETLPEKSECERLAELEARVLALEKALAERFVVPDGGESERETEPAPPRRLRWLPKESCLTENPRQPFDARREDTLVYNLQQSAGATIAIRSLVGDATARHLADRIKAIFERAAWNVRGVDEVSMQVDEHGLVLAAGSLPAPPHLATAYLAFLAAGIPVTSRLDPQLGQDDAVLCVV
jgi:hypothetical protein